MERNSLYRHLIAWIFLAAFFAQTFSKTFVIADYYSNVTTYAANCENKARPKLHCNGKCIMMKKLQQQEKKEQDNPERKLAGKPEITFLPKSLYTTTPAYLILLDDVKEGLPYPDPVYSDYALDIFHPPQC